MKLNIELLYAKFLQSKSVSTDTRKINKGDLFFALKGPNFDGNKYAANALESGASFAVVDDPEVVLDDRFVLVEDTLVALQELAKFHRSKFKRPVIGLTGSNGKTTTKELINVVLQSKFITYATVGNLNNHIGVPLTILSINPQVEIAIVEMGASAVSEIALLCGIANPTHGLITNIGKAHTETFGGIEGVLRGKSELFDHLRNHEGEVFINQNDERLVNMKKRFNDAILYPADDLSNLRSTPFLKYNSPVGEIETQLIGAYNFDNVAAAIAIGRFFGIEEEKIHGAIQNYSPGNNRSQFVKTERNRVIQDAYNANPDSMKIALRNLAEMEGKKVAIVGDMNELENPEQEHGDIGNLLSELKFDKVLLCGRHMKHAKQNGFDYFETTDELIEYLKSEPLEDSTILTKASRSLRFERIFDYL